VSDQARRGYGSGILRAWAEDAGWEHGRWGRTGTVWEGIRIQ